MACPATFLWSASVLNPLVLSCMSLSGLLSVLLDWLLSSCTFFWLASFLIVSYTICYLSLLCLLSVCLLPVSICILPVSCLFFVCLLSDSCLPLVLPLACLLPDFRLPLDSLYELSLVLYFVSFLSAFLPLWLSVFSLMFVFLIPSQLPALHATLRVQLFRTPGRQPTVRGFNW